MEQQHPHPPPAYSHEPDTFFLPSVPTQDPVPSRPQSVVHLPKLESLHLLPSPSQQSEVTWHVKFPQVPTGNIGSPSTTDGTITPNDKTPIPTPRPSSVISIDDPDVRIAAEAMCEISKSPNTRSVPPIQTKDLSRKREREPLLRLLTTSHPWLGTTINGSLTAYALTKNYSPRVVRDSAEYIERNIGSPVARTVSTVGRRTGVESGIRRYLGEHEIYGDLEAQEEGPGKRRRIEKSDTAEPDLTRPISIQLPTRVRNDSQSSYAESLPAYDENRSPKYEEAVIADTNTADQEPDQRVNWSTQLIMTTSGLGAALHKESLEKLKYCMSLIRHFTEKLDEAMEALKRLLNEYEENRRSRQDGLAHGEVHGNRAVQLPEAKEARSRQLADQMKELGSTIWKMLHHVMQSVIKYTWGALPDNASRVVRGQVLSAPERWRRIQHSETGAVQGVAYEATATHHMLAFAKESLEMMAQVSAVIGGTIESAEAWLDRMGRHPDGMGVQPIDIKEQKKQDSMMVGNR